jgi:hypothetical protein
MVLFFRTPSGQICGFSIETLPSRGDVEALLAAAGCPFDHPFWVTVGIILGETHVRLRVGDSLWRYGDFSVLRSGTAFAGPFFALGRLFRWRTSIADPSAGDLVALASAFYAEEAVGERQTEEAKGLLEGVLRRENVSLTSLLSVLAVTYCRRPLLDADDLHAEALMRVETLARAEGGDPLLEEFRRRWRRLISPLGSSVSSEV